MDPIIQSQIEDKIYILNNEINKLQKQINDLGIMKLNSGVDHTKLREIHNLDKYMFEVQNSKHKEFCILLTKKYDNINELTN